MTINKPTVVPGKQQDTDHSNETRLAAQKREEDERKQMQAKQRHDDEQAKQRK